MLKKSLHIFKPLKILKTLWSEILTNFKNVKFFFIIQ